MYLNIKALSILLLYSSLSVCHPTVHTSTNAEEIFTTIFHQNFWADGDSKESVSGAGSSLNATEPIRKSLPEVIKEYSITSILDAPCGDFHWLSTVDLGNCFYMGVDIVKPLIEKNTSLFSRNLRLFMHMNVITDPLPRVDLILCRDLFIHLDYASVFETLRNFKRSGSRYLLVTMHPYTKENKDISMGMWHGLNFEIAPFNFPKPLLLLDDKEGYACHDQVTSKFLGLWRLEDLPL